MPATSTLLTGLSVATGIAQEATDGVPIAKQVLGAVSRLVTLAQLVDKNREDLRALADRATKIGDAIEAVLAGRKPDARMAPLLESVNDILSAIEKHFAAHIKRGRLRKMLGYVFTVRKDIDRLKGELDTCLELIQTTVPIHTAISVTENSRYIGQFHNIPDCEIDDLTSIPVTWSKNNTGNLINCRLTTYNGSKVVVVVRKTETLDREERERLYIEDHDRILEKLSYVQNRHPNIARLYGRAKPDPVIPSLYNRFIVLKPGDVRTLGDVLFSGDAEVSTLGRIVAHLTAKDAVFHLTRHGAWWDLPLGSLVFGLCLDHNHEPKIGVHDDLSTISEYYDKQSSWLPAVLTFLLKLTNTSSRFRQRDVRQDHTRSTAWFTQLFGELIDAGFPTQTRACIVRRAEISTFIPLTRDTRKDLSQLGGSALCAWLEWGDILLCLAVGQSRREGSLLHARYCSNSFGEDDYIDVNCVEDDVDAVYHTWTRIQIPRVLSYAVRSWLEIDTGDDEEEEAEQDEEEDDTDAREFHLQRFAGVGETSMECGGWNKDGHPWTE